MEKNQASNSQEPSSRRYTVKQLKKLKSRAEHYLKFDLHMLMLKQLSASGIPNEKNYCPWKTVKEGSYYLGNVYPLMKKYMKYNPGKVYDKNMESVIETMVALGFDPSYNTIGFTDEAYDGEFECFVSKGKGTMYYKLLHSDYMKDIRFFVEMTERDIDIPIRRFLQSIEQQLEQQSKEQSKEQLSS